MIVKIRFCKKKKKRTQKRSPRFVPGQPVPVPWLPSAVSFSPSKSVSLQLPRFSALPACRENCCPTELPKSLFDRKIVTMNARLSAARWRTRSDLRTAATSRGVLYKTRRRHESELVPANKPMGKLPEPATRRAAYKSETPPKDSAPRRKILIRTSTEVEIRNHWHGKIERKGI